MNFIDRVVYMILSPKMEWEVIASEEPDEDAIFMRFALPLIIASAAITSIGHAVFWTNGAYGTDALIKRGVYYGLQTVLIGAGGVWLAAALLNELAKKFGAEKNMGRSMQLITYAMIPMMLGGLAMIYPPVGIIGLLFGLYGLYLLYLGLPQMMKAPQDNIILYRAISIVMVLLVFAALLIFYRLVFWDTLVFSLKHVLINARPFK
jgi:hypothetical protein